MTAAAEIPVRLFREILLWPLALAGVRAGEDMGDAVREVDTALCAQNSGWEPVTDLRRHLAEDAGEALSRDSFAEVVYFHPFVRELLFEKDTTRLKAPSIRLYRRADIQKVRLTAPGEEGRHFCLSVDRVNLYLFDTGNLVLAVEVSSQDGLAVETGEGAKGGCEAMTLADAQTILCRLRRAHPAFWFDDNAPLPAECLAKVDWLTGAPPTDTSEDLVAILAATGQPPAFGHWRELLRPLSFQAHAEDGAALPALRQVVDERIPTMVQIGVEDPRDITPGDWARLCFCDEPGDGAPYAEGFLKDFAGTYAYDRFWQDGEGWLNTRMLFCGYNFALVGQAHAGPKSFFRDDLSKHFRRHYFQLGLLAHFQKAALLTLSDAVSQTVGALAEAPADPEVARANMERLHKRALNFTHRYWFPDVTNHIQGQEMFAAWRGHLGGEAAFAQLTREVGESHAFLDAEVQRRMATEQSATAAAAMRLNLLATGGLTLALTTGVLGMNVLSGGKWGDMNGWVELGAVFIAFLLLALAAWRVTGGGKVAQAMRGWWGGYAVAVAIILAVIGLWRSGPFPTACAPPPPPVCAPSGQAPPPG